MKPFRTNSVARRSMVGLAVALSSFAVVAQSDPDDPKTLAPDVGPAISSAAILAPVGAVKARVHAAHKLGPVAVPRKATRPIPLVTGGATGKEKKPVKMIRDG